MASESSPRKWIYASLFAALLGIVDMAILTAQHYHIAEKRAHGKELLHAVIRHRL